MALKLKNGKFFRDGNPVPLEFGNQEQIDLMKAELSKLAPEIVEDSEEDDGKNSSVEVDVHIEETTTYTASVSLKCSCGAYVRWSGYEPTEWEDEATDDLQDEKERCRTCHKEYRLEKRDKGWFAVLINFKP